MLESWQSLGHPPWHCARAGFLDKFLSGICIPIGGAHFKFSTLTACFLRIVFFIVLFILYLFELALLENCGKINIKHCCCLVIKSCPTLLGPHGL